MRRSPRRLIVGGLGLAAVSVVAATHFTGGEDSARVPYVCRYNQPLEAQNGLFVTIDTDPLAPRPLCGRDGTVDANDNIGPTDVVYSSRCSDPERVGAWYISHCTAEVGGSRR